MSGKYTWKLILTAVVVFWASWNIIPLSSTPFEEYLRREATSSPAFEALMVKAKQRYEAKEAPSFYMAVKQVAEADAVDLSQFFPQVNLEKSLQNIRKKNSILLDHLLKESQARLRKGLDLSGGVSFLLEVDRPAGTTDAAQQRADLEKAIEIIGDRIDGLGVSEPIIRPVGDNRIEVQIAGVNTRDNPEVVNELKKPARLEFRLVDMVNRPNPANPTDVPIGYEMLVLQTERGANSYEEELFVKRVPEMTGEAVERAFVYRNDYGQAEVGLRFTSKGGERFGEVTRKIVEEHGRGRLAIVLDGKLYSAPTVNDAITGGSAQITGSFTDREAFELANVLNNPLDVPLRVVSMSEVGPSLAADSIVSGRNAFIIGTAITAVFMMVFYTIGGVLAVVAMVTNVLIIVGVMASIGTTLSMPGIAGIVLTLGMSVDSNILIFERIREELAAGKNLRAALEAGHEKAFSAIFDANITTLITSAIMIKLGTGAVRGFGVTLTIGIFSTMFAALVITRLLMELVVLTGAVKRIKFMSLPLPGNIDFLKYARPAFIASWVIVLIGVGVVIAKGDRIYGVDFLGGDEVSFLVKPERQVDVGRINAALKAAGVPNAMASYVNAIGTDKTTLKVQTEIDQGNRAIEAITKAFPEAGFEPEGVTQIGAAVSSQLKWNAFLAIGISLIGILLYVAFRFEIGYGVGAVVATIHDLFMTIGMFVIFGRQFDAAMVAAILLIVGYSINDTIVVFDRIREELQLNPNMKLRDVINRSLNLTLLRTINTGGTTFLTAISLFLVATGAVNDIALTLIIGIITGTFSSLFIASPIFFWWHKGDRKHVEESHDITPKYEWSAGSRAAE